MTPHVYYKCLFCDHLNYREVDTNPAPKTSSFKCGSCNEYAIHLHKPDPHLKLKCKCEKCL